MACIPLPENITLQGSTFAEALEMSLSTQCSVSIEFTSVSETNAKAELQRKKDEEFKIWRQNNFGVTYTSLSSNYREIENAIWKKLDEKYPDKPTTVKHTIETKDGIACLQIVNTKECKKEDTALIKDAGKPVSLLQVKDNEAFVFSVDAQGEKDMRKPYLKLTPKGKVGADIEAIESGTTIGKMDIPGEDCSQASARGSFAKGGIGIGGDAAGGSGNLELRGKQYISEGAGCSGGFVSEDLAQPKGQLLRNGQNVNKSK
jgi:hypothetical protein